MITADMLGALKDDELHWVINHSQELLKKRDADRKAKALADARAILQSAGLSLKDINGKGKTKPNGGHLYKSGHLYQHPTDKTLVWKANGQKPNWLRDLETHEGHAIEVKEQ